MTSFQPSILLTTACSEAGPGSRRVLRRAARRSTALADVESPDPLVESLVEWKALANNRRFESLFNQILNRTGIIRRELFQQDDEPRSNQWPVFLRNPPPKKPAPAGCDLARLISTLPLT